MSHTPNRPHRWSRFSASMLVAAVAVAVAIGVATAPTAAAATVYGRVLNAYGRCLENAGNATAVPNKIQIANCGSGPAQQWSRQPDGTIRTQSGRCLGLYRNGTANNTINVLDACTASVFQQWTLVNNSLVNKGAAKCLQFLGANWPGSWAGIVACNNSAQQRWTAPALSTVDPPKPTTTTPPKTTTTPPATTSNPPVTATNPPATTSNPPVTTTTPPVTTTTTPPVTTTTPPVTTNPPVTTPSEPPAETTTTPLPPSVVKPWSSDLSKSDVVKAGFADNSYNRQLGDGAYNNPALPWPIATVPAPGGRAGNAIPFTLPNNAIRLEVEPKHQAFAEGDDAYFGFSFYLGADFPLATQSWNVIEQLHAAPNYGSPPVSFQAAKGGLLLDGGWGKPGVADPMTYAYQKRLMDLVPQRWYDVVYHVHFSASADKSVVDAWVDGKQVLAGFHPPGGTVYAATPTDDRVGTYRKEGFYHSASIPGGTFYMAGQRFGATYADADPTSKGLLTLTAGLN